jgi:general secretion pathway protein G
LQRGVTLVEVMIVVLIISMVAGGAAVFALPRYREAQIKSAETWARTIRAAVQNWQSSSNEISCPTVSQLVQEKHLDSGTSTVDPWGQPFTLTCTEDEVFVLSNGPDKKKGTKDDIQIPKATTTESGGS